MNNFNPARAYGIVFGVIIGTLISVVLLMSINRNRSLRTEYDEMQKKARGEAYMYGFFTVLVLEVLLGLAETFGPLPMEPLVSRLPLTATCRPTTDAFRMDRRLSRRLRVRIRGRH